MKHWAGLKRLRSVREEAPSGEEASLPLSQVASSYSPRAQRLDLDHARTLAQSGSRLPPILVHRPSMQVIDGNHRIMAARLRGETTVRVRFFDGTLEEALLLAIRSNVRHGKPLTLSERKRAAHTVLRQRPELSDGVIAECCGLSPGTIRFLRESSTSQNEKLTHRIGRDGRRRPTGRGRARNQAITYLSDHPNASVREVAEALDISPGTVRAAMKLIIERQQVDETPSAATFPHYCPEEDDSNTKLNLWLEATNISDIDGAIRHCYGVDYERLIIIAKEARHRSASWLHFAEAIECRLDTFYRPAMPSNGG